jgi:hypothetical protein
MHMKKSIQNCNRLLETPGVPPARSSGAQNPSTYQSDCMELLPTARCSICYTLVLVSSVVNSFDTVRLLINSRQYKLWYLSEQTSIVLSNSQVKKTATIHLLETGVWYVNEILVMKAQHAGTTWEP